MVGVSELILCDIGNTSTKFFINDEIKNYYKNDEIPSFEEEIFYISVNEKAKVKLLEKNPQAKDLSFFITFKTSYIGMGIDRVVACCFQKNAVIVDAGSAITVDIIENSVHKGGFILLGINSFVKSYKNISEKLKVDFEKNINLDKIPLQTKDAILYALIKSIILPIKEICKDKNIIFTGGDGEFLSSFFKNSQYKKDLIFENMKRIIDANDCIA
ncbi:type III pantothenate kinase [Aliarcobacter cibarius]|uniref:Type III pantothenate kinase n=1 Tax=Aliarcobacter cibarius TaxID=255507 RepID=A0ABY2V5Z8_9BACT|nr:type III pantothenate kinase [Aliarcobacter cibarius]TLT01068.1 type III pantothenate kinase [Aliarcobacter cibarius]TLT01165.1 type III pantothenate kinase [Aliarcobacter cibarius]